MSAGPVIIIINNPPKKQPVQSDAVSYNEADDTLRIELAPKDGESIACLFARALLKYYRD